MFPFAQVFNDLLLGSDHCPLITNCCIPLKSVPYNFKFESLWCTNDDCGGAISDAWNSEQPGSAMFKLTQKLKNCKEALQIWSKKTFGNNKAKIKRLNLSLSLVHQLLFS